MILWLDELATQLQQGFWGFYGFFRSLEIFLLVPLLARLTSMVISRKFPSSSNKTPNTPTVTRSPCPARVSGTGFFKTKPRAIPKNPLCSRPLFVRLLIQTAVTVLLEIFPLLTGSDLLPIYISCRCDGECSGVKRFTDFHSGASRR